ncbi:MAG TPA: VTT domain-containing protein [Syntrophobacteraceae bacterium]|nr:VTT domain-containing protein [Syntrophobacteraceae bacterium]
MDETKPRKSNFVWLRLCALVLIVGGLSFFLYKFDFVDLFVSKQKMIAYLNSLGPWRSVGFAALQAIQVIIAPIPGEVTGILGGYLFGLINGLALSTVGLTIGSYVAFLLARVFGKPFVEKIVPQPIMQRFHYLVQHKGLFLVFLLFLIPGIPKDYFCYIFGLSAISTLEYLVLSTIGRLFGTILLTLEGSSLKYEHYWLFWTLAAVGVLSGLLAFIFRNSLERAFRRLNSGG